MSLLIVIIASVIMGLLPTGIKYLSVMASNLLPKNLKHKYQNSSFYLKKYREVYDIAISLKFSDKFKLGLINKKTLKKMTSLDLIDIVDNLKYDENKLKFLLKSEVLKNIFKMDSKITFNDKNFYESLYNSVNDDEKINLLTHINNDEFVIEKYDHLKKKLSDKNKCKIICSLENDDNKTKLINDVKIESLTYQILCTYKSFEKVENYLLSLKDLYQYYLVKLMSEEEIIRLLEKNLLIKQILRCTNNKERFNAYFSYLSLKDQIDVLKINPNSEMVLSTYLNIKDMLSEKEKLEILVNILKNGDENIKKEAFNYLPNSVIKDIILTNEEKHSDENVKLYNGVSDKVTFGVELESSHKDSLLIKKLGTINSNWILKGDSSIKGGVEIVSPILHYDKKSLMNLKYVCDFMEANNFEVTNECGGHIHIGFDFFDNVKELEMLYMIYGNAQDIFFDICNRKGSIQRPKLLDYAKPITSKLYLAIITHKFDDNINLNAFVKEMKELQSGRFFDINILNAQSKLKNTIEFRFPNGEINYEEVLLNITLIIKLCIAAKKYASINCYDEKYSVIKLLQCETNKDTRKNILFKILFDNDEMLKNIYNERYEANNKEDVFERRFVIDF